MSNKKIEINLPVADDIDIDFSNYPTKAQQLKLQDTLQGIEEKLKISILQSFDRECELLNAIKPVLLDFAKREMELSASIKPIADSIRQITEQYANAIAQFKIPTVTEERKQELISSHKLWGTYGWTFPPFASITCFYNPPNDIKESNSLMKGFCSKDAVESLFSKLQKQNIDKDDLQSAITCYNIRQYKACALLLFAIIDAKLIRNQNPDTKYRPSGRKAAVKLQEQFEKNSNELMLCLMLHGVNFLSCLETFFANADNFKSEPVTINRNFVSHGMTKRRVRQRDCIQLFFLLYNLTLFFRFTS